MAIGGRKLIRHVTDVSQKLSMQKALSEKVNQPGSQDAYVFAQVEQASTYLGNKGDLPAARKLLDECERLLDTFDFVETIVHAKFYRENAAYYKVHIFTPSTLGKI
jgi:26S proteasome regulatory subunit N9